MKLTTGVAKTFHGPIFYNQAKDNHRGSELKQFSRTPVKLDSHVWSTNRNQRMSQGRDGPLLASLLLLLDLLDTKEQFFSLSNISQSQY